MSNKPKLLNDYKGAVKGDLKLADFSKEFLEKLGKEWQGDYLRGAEIWHTLIREKLGDKEADALETRYHREQAKIHLPRIAKVAGIEVKDLVDIYKTIQLNMDGMMGFQPIATIELVNGNRNHLNITFVRCLNLEFFEKHDPGRIPHVCRFLEGYLMEQYIKVFFDDIEVKPLKLPPRENPAEIACQWEWKRGK